MFRSSCQKVRLPVQVRYLKAEGQRIPGLHEPKYLDDLRPKVGFYGLLNLQLKSYDFVMLEKYQSYLHKVMKQRLGIHTTKAWAAPHQDLLIENLVDQSSAVDTSFTLRVHERNIQMKNALVTQIPPLIDIIHHTLPPGVTFEIDKHTQADEDKLYFKDSVLEKLKEELQDLKDTPLIGA